MGGNVDFAIIAGYAPTMQTVIGKIADNMKKEGTMAIASTQLDKVNRFWKQWA